MSQDRLHVLLVEDNPLDTDLLQEAVLQANEPLDIHAVERMDLALAYLKRGKRLDAILLDLSLPDSTGLGTLGRINEAASQLPVIVLTGLEDESLGIEAVRMGAQDYLVKGQTAPRMLVRAIQYAMERKHLQEALRQSESRYRHLLGVLPAAVFTCDCEGRITLFNERATELWGRQPRPHLDRWFTMQRMNRPDGTPLLPQECPVSIALREGHSVRGAEVVVELPNGKPVYVLTHCDPIRNDAGAVVGAVNVFIDISDRKRAEEALKEADRRKDEFLATLAHELRNPLMPIRTAMQLIGQNADDPATVNKAQIVAERQLLQLVELVDDLLDVSRITRGHVELRKEEVDLATIIDSAIETASPSVEAGHHRLVVNKSSDDILLLADPTRLSQAISNLLINAAKYTDDGGQIELAVRRWNEAVSIEVKDNGIGISSELLPTVFDMFMQADRSKERAWRGLGVGLTLVRRLVEMHGGTVQASSEGRGRGSTFTIQLPLPAANKTGRKPGRSTASSGVAQPGTPRNILIVDDNEDAAMLLAQILEMSGHETHTAHDGPSAVEAALSLRPDVVFLDIGMPGMSGHEVACRLRKAPELLQTTLVALTGWGEDKDREKSKAAGFDYHLVKPVDVEAVQSLIASKPR